MKRERKQAALWAVAASVALAAFVVLGSRNLAHFDAALVGYTFATLFAVWGTQIQNRIHPKEKPKPVWSKARPKI